MHGTYAPPAFHSCVIIGVYFNYIISNHQSIPSLASTLSVYLDSPVYFLFFPSLFSQQCWAIIWGTVLLLLWSRWWPGSLSFFYCGPIGPLVTWGTFFCCDPIGGLGHCLFSVEVPLVAWVTVFLLLWSRWCPGSLSFFCWGPLVIWVTFFLLLWSRWWPVLLVAAFLTMPPFHPDVVVRVGSCCFSALNAHYLLCHSPHGERQGQLCLCSLQNCLLQALLFWRLFLCLLPAVLPRS